MRTNLRLKLLLDPCFILDTKDYTKASVRNTSSVNSRFVKSVDCFMHNNIYHRFALKYLHIRAIIQKPAFKWKLYNFSPYEIANFT